MNLKASAIENFKNQWNEMIERGIIPVINFTGPDGEVFDSKISFEFNKRCAWFEFTHPSYKENDIRFSGEVRKVSECCSKMYCDNVFDNIDHYLQEIYSELTEGIIL